MRILRLIFATLLVTSAVAVHAQSVVSSAKTYDWAAATTGTAGQLGQYLVLNGLNSPRPANYTIDVTVSGTAPSVCTFRVEGSSDASAWYGVDVSSPSTNSCTANFMEHIASRPVRFLRINLTYTQGDTTSKVVFHYTGS